MSKGSTLAVRVSGANLARQHDMIADPHRVVPERLRPTCEVEAAAYPRPDLKPADISQCHADAHVRSVEGTCRPLRGSLPKRTAGTRRCPSGCHQTALPPRPAGAVSSSQMLRQFDVP
jgi:hypothetical protein